MTRLTNGGIIGKITTTPTTSSAIGKWNLSDQFIYKHQNMWTGGRIPPITTSLLSVYDGDSWNGSSWLDIYGSYHATTIRGTINNVSTTGNGASKTFNALSGNTGAGLQFPTGILPATYTLFHVTRTTGASARIVTGSNNNWLSTHWGGRSGVAYHEGWVTSSENYLHGNNWVYSTDQNYLLRTNGVSRGTGSPGASTNLSINHGTYAEYSDWACALVVVYNRTLSSSEYIEVENWIQSKYGV